MRTHQLAVGGASVMVREWGPPDGLPLLQLHALGPAASAALTDLMVGPLVARGVRVVAPDGPGFGGSEALPPQEYAVPLLADRVWALAERLGLEELVLVGHSWGGAIACHAAAAHPERVRALVLLDSGHLDYRDAPGVDLETTLEKAIERARGTSWEVGSRADLEEMLGIEDPARRARLADLMLHGLTRDGAGGLVATTPGEVRGAVLFHLAHALQSETWPVIAEAGIPTLLLLATEPPEAAELNRVAADRFAAAVPTADVRHLEGASHGMMTDLEDALGAMVADWLAARGLL